MVDRFARLVAVSQRVRWDIGKGVIRERVIDTGEKFLPDWLTRIDQIQLSFMGGPALSGPRLQARSIFA
jgi:hypothetical protein